jgi:hypothetical protein
MARGAMLACGLLACLGLSTAGPAAAGTVLVYEDTPQGNRTSLSFQGNRLRVEIGPEGHRRAILFRLEAVRGAASATVSSVAKTVMTDEETKTYIEVVAAIPADPAAPGPTLPTYTRVAQGVRVGRFTADQYEVSAAGTASGARSARRSVMDLWIADPAQLHIDPADTSTFRAVRQRYAGATQPSILGYLAAENAPAGVPVKAVLHERDLSSSIEVVSVEQRDLPGAAFEVPSGYKRVEAPLSPSERPPEKPHP